MTTTCHHDKLPTGTVDFSVRSGPNLGQGAFALKVVAHVDGVSLPPGFTPPVGTTYIVLDGRAHVDVELVGAAAEPDVLASVTRKQLARFDTYAGAKA